jgi:predicted transcriptional regulator
MRATDTVTISLPPDLASAVDRLAREEGRTRSGLLREAFRQYAERRRRWDALFRYGQTRAAAVGLTEEAVTQGIAKRRRAHRTAKR